MKNARKELSKNTLGIPTVAIGIPTVMQAKALVEEYSKTNEKYDIDLLVTPKDVDLLSHRITEALATAINLFLQPKTDRETIINLV